MNIIYIFAIYGLMLLFKEIEGPFGIVAKFRNALMRTPFGIGVFFYKLLECSYCTGFWAGIITYFLATNSIELNIWDGSLWGLGGAGLCYILARY